MSRYAGTLGNEMDRYRIAGDNEANPFPAIKSFSFAYRNIIINYILLCMHIYMEAKRHWSLDQLSARTGRKCQEIDTQTLFPFFFVPFIYYYSIWFTYQKKIWWIVQQSIIACDDSLRFLQAICSRQISVATLNELPVEYGHSQISYRHFWTLLSIISQIVSLNRKAIRQLVKTVTN